MKTFQVILSVLAIFLFSLNLSAQAPDLPDPCVPDCEQTPWGALQSVRVFLSNACTPSTDFVIYYHFRKACGVYQDFNVVGIVPASPNWSSNCDLDAVIGEAITRFFTDTDFGLEPDELGECATNYRVSMSGCWQAIASPIKGNLIVPCEEDESCCITPIKVCIDEFGIKTVAPTAPYYTLGTEPACPDPGQIPLPNGDCRNACGWYIAAGLDFASAKSGAVLPADTGFEALPVANTGGNREISFQLNNALKGNLSATIYDLSGQIVRTLQTQSPGGSYNIPLSIADLSPGVYVYRIMIAGTGQIATGKLQLLELR